MNRNSVIANFATTASDGKTYHVEYDKFKKKQDDILSPVEKHFIESIDRLEQISTKK